MTPSVTLSVICDFVSETLKNMRITDDKGKERSIAVHRFHLPVPPRSQMRNAQELSPNDYESTLPAVVVNPISYEDKSFDDGDGLMVVLIQVACYSDSIEQGRTSVLNVLEKIRLALKEQRVLADQCEAEDPISWELGDNSTAPVWEGELMTYWRIREPNRLSSGDWRGDLVY